jgi:hypothetical protein
MFLYFSNSFSNNDKKLTTSKKNKIKKDLFNGKLEKEFYMVGDYLAATMIVDAWKKNKEWKKKNINK